MNKKLSLVGTEMTFTGPRASDMTSEQRRSVIELLNKFRPSLINNGCAKGRDQELIEILIAMQLPLLLRLWPADKERMDAIRVLTMGKLRTEWRAIHDPLKRNRMMVDSAEWLLAVPDTTAPLPNGSGTWYTVKYALKNGCPVVMVWPNGDVQQNYGRA